MGSSWESDVAVAVDRIVRRSVRPVVGCGLDELRQFETDHGLKLPGAYRGYLVKAGKDSGSFLAGSDLAFAELASLQTAARALLRDDGGPALPSDALVFCVHQGYQFLFLRLDGDSDPEVMSYLEGEGAFRVVAPRFSKWLLDASIDELGE